MKTTKKQRAILLQYIDEQTIYKADSVRISKEGVVSARKDADKTFNGPHTERFDLGTVTELLSSHTGNDGE